jgi:hypothetical protein
MSDQIALFWWISGTQGDSIHTIRIDKTKTVGELKSAIKAQHNEDEERTLAGFPVSHLSLRKVSSFY